MAIRKIHLVLLRFLTASFSCLLLTACPGSDQDGESINKTTISKELKREPMQVPASFTKQHSQKLSQQLDSVFTYLHKRKGFNGTVLVTKYDRVLYKGAFGYTDFKDKDTLTTQTAFQLASVSKQFTAMAIMMLHEQGKLQYDDSVQQYLPGFPYSGVTIRQLLNHRSGLANYTYFSDKLWPDRNKAITNHDVVELMRLHQPNPYYPPNTHFDYSNTGYMLLATIVEKVSGEDFATYLQEHIFEPLDMEHTFTYSNSVATLTGKIATGHTGGRRKRTPDYLDTVLGDKGIYSTVEDLYKWDQALYSQQLVSHKTLKEAFTGSRPNKREKDEDYGFGWRIKQLDNGDTVVYHGGLWHGYATYLLRNPKDHSALIVLSNVPNGSQGHLKDVKQLLYPAVPKQLAQQNKAKQHAGVN